MNFIKAIVITMVLVGTSLAGDTPETVNRLRDNLRDNMITINGYKAITGIARNAIWIQREPESDDMICIPVPIPKPNSDDE